MAGGLGGRLLRDRLSMSVTEIIATLLGLANIVLLVRRSVWNYPFGLAMVALYAWLFYGARLYSDALLQLFFIVVQCYGWWAWARAREAHGAIVVERLPVAGRIGWVAGGAIATLAWGRLMQTQTDALFPYWDASVAMFSVCAQLLLTRRYIENWLMWIAVDADAIGLYAARGLYPTTGLYILFFLLAIWGFVTWARQTRHGMVPL